MALEAQGGPSRPVMMDVARLAGVSQKTVSRVINDAPNVSPDVRARVLAAVESLGYRPNAAARALVTRRTNVLGIVTPGTALYGPSAQLFGLERATWDHGYAVVIVSTKDATVAEFERAVGRLIDLGVDGILLGGPLTKETVPDEVFRGVPAVAVGDPLFGNLSCPAVGPEQSGGAQAATRHLLELGHRTVWHVTGPIDQPSSAADGTSGAWHSALERHAGWRLALTEAGAPVPEPVPGDWSLRSGYDAGRLLAVRSDVTAVFTANDHMAVGLLRAMAEAGRRVPEDVSVVGFDDIPEAAFLPTPLTTVRQDFEEISRVAVDLLVAAISDGPVRDHPRRTAVADRTVVPVTLVRRASTGPPRG